MIAARTRLVCCTAALLVSAIVATAPAVDRDLRKLARSSDHGDRIDAVWDLAKESTDDAAVALYVELLVDEHPLVRDNAVMAASKFKSDEAVARIAKKARTRDAIDRSNVAMALAMTGSPAALPALEKLALEDKDATVRRDALWELARFKSSEAAFDIAAKAAEDSDPRVRVAAVRTARFTDQDRAEALVKAALDDVDDRVRHMALLQMWSYGEDAAAPLMASAVSDSSHRVRLAAATLAWSFRSKRAIDVLVPLVADEREHVAALAHRTLRLITKKSLDRDPQLWTAWWNGARESWKPRKDVKSAWFWDDKYASPASIYGARLTSDALVIVVDVSSALATQRNREETRWDEVRKRLSEAVAKLEDGTLLNIVTMNEDVESAFPEPRPLDDRARKRIEQFLDAVRPAGDCDLWGGLSTALAQPGIDTVVVVASEKRNLGEVRHSTRVWACAQREYFTNALIVHTVRIAEDDEDDPDFLHRFSKDTLGRSRKRVF